MDWTALNILYITLAICAGLLTIFICIVLFHVMNILRDVEKVVYKVEETTDRINRFVAQPIKLATKLVEGVDTLVGIISRRFAATQDEADDEKDDL